MRKFLSAMLAAVLLAGAFFCVPLSVKSAKVERELAVLDEKFWHSDSVRFSNRRVNGKNAVSASRLEDAEEFSFRADFNSVDLFDSSELILTMNLRGDDSEYNVCVVLASKDKGIAADPYNVKVQCNGNQKVYIPLDGEIASSLSSMEITITSVAGDTGIPSYVIITSVGADNTYSYSYRDIFGADTVENKTGDAVETENGIKITPTSNGTAVISPKFNCDTSDDGIYIVWLDFETNAAGSIKAIAKLGGEDVPSSSAQVVVSGRNTYSFVVEGAFSTIAFNLENLSAPGEDITVYATGGGVIPAGSPNRETVGAVTSCKYENGCVTVSGQITDEAAVKYVKAQLGVYVIHAGDDAKGSLEGEADTVSGFSSRFSLSVAADDSYTSCMYQPVIIPSDDEVIPIGYPVTVRSAYQNQGAKSFSAALDGADVSELLRSNVSSGIIDIYTDRLIHTGDIYSSAVFTYAGEVYYFDSEYVRELSKKLEFASGAGIQVIARIVSDEESKGFDFDPYDAVSVRDMCAICTYVAKQYPSVSGFVMGTALNSQYILDGGGAEKCADLAALFAETLRSVNTAADIYLPFSCEGEARALAAYTAVRYMMSRRTSVGVTMLCVCSCDQPANTAAEAMRAVSAVSTWGSFSDGCAILWQPKAGVSKENAVNTFCELCKKSVTQGVRMTVLSAGEYSDDEAFCNILKSRSSEYGSFSATVEKSVAYVKSSPANGKLSLWSFEKSYDTAGWISGGGFGQTLTDTSALKSGRALVASSQSAAGGILVRTLESTPDLSGTEIAISLGVVSDQSGETEITVILGNKDMRKEFSAIVENNTPTELYCNIGEGALAANVGYAAITTGKGVSSVEIYEVKICSDTLSDEELSRLFGKQNESETDPVLYIVLILVGAGTVIVFLALDKKHTWRENRS